jgi:acyl-coenzyme A synthetase/AMP-(fatty) acid ligase
MALKCEADFESQPMHFLETVLYWAKSDPRRPALIEPNSVITYRALVNAIVSIEKRIAQLNLSKQEPVAVSLAIPSFFIATVLALLRSGYDTALVNPRRFPLLQPSGIRNIIHDSEGLLLSGGRNVRFDKNWLSSSEAEAIRTPSGRGRDNTMGNVVFFTSGTTGLPKKIVQTNSALETLLNYPVTCASGSRERILIMPGLSSTLGFNRVCEVLAAGKSALFAPNAALAVAMINNFEIEVVVASTAQALSLLDIKKRNPGFDFGSVKALFVAGAKIDAKRIAELRVSICRNILMQYGSTEAGVVTLYPTHLTKDIEGIAGIIMPWVEMEIVDEVGQPVTAGSTGLVRYRTPQLLANLTHPESGSFPGVQDNWFYPGDIGALDGEGLLRLQGRTSDVINRAGVKVSGAKIEEILTGLPQVKEAAACGVMAQSGIEEVWVAVVPSGELDLTAVKRTLEEHDDVAFAPDELFVVNALPRGDLGKVQQHRLREMLQKLQRDRSPPEPQ